MAEQIGRLTLDHKVPGLYLDGVKLMIVWYFIAQSASLSPFHHFYMT